jgi:hypothetical protein
VESLGVVYRWEDMADQAPEELAAWTTLAQSHLAPPKLAAEGGGLRGRLAFRLADSARPRWQEVACRLSGRFFLMANHSGVQGFYISAGRTPPRVRREGQEQLAPVRWSRREGVFVFDVVPWREDRAVLRIGRGEGRKVVVRR